MKYSADYRYTKDGLVYIEEVKGIATEAYRIRLKLFLSDAHLKHGIDVFREIFKDKTNVYYLKGGINV